MAEQGESNNIELKEKKYEDLNLNVRLPKRPPPITRVTFIL